MPPVTNPPARTARLTRATKETEVTVALDLDGTGKTSVNTGIGFLDHMVTALAFHARVDLELNCRGDLQVDDHHTAEDCALAVGDCMRQALGDRAGIARFGYAYAPLDEALARAVVDISGRPFARVALGMRREKLGELACENVAHFFSSFAMAAKLTLHVDVIDGENDHHRAEAAFKALALALRQAIAVGESAEVPSTKGSLA
jgi:imidazoleglycerol phosphate dehydratase HisB